ncbi:hypothetical protein BB558_006206 [Smittium angustum]|uniref:Uncharacterized protein n=1 Tax=Smittium angustum TaxID=133377 RepID=A0A2U1IYE2_SMIAN|nr:hypothetical protein BB558_006206 [Smittium angustum]
MNAFCNNIELVMYEIGIGSVQPTESTKSVKYSQPVDYRISSQNTTNELSGVVYSKVNILLHRDNVSVESARKITEGLLIKLDFIRFPNHCMLLKLKNPFLLMILMIENLI